ncbi:winged helix-turn-helix domain-containing protein [Streptomyces sp. Je 1-79]|uniref:AfsR/SARP family transcriptional regulator n=1 Tax=Streptomyces sp. Je 1-79 TaxID=2943847 RepID=UPI0021A46C5C|nr:AfsR/SARP family transcriptional regulator [Streptomyces sp. Je 1-79]MCT4353752.1 winged helix-turn-helix domain-containing protein [Streptomyces sp. Je 1-79]
MTCTGAPLRIQLLGPIRAWRHGEEVALGSPKQRAVLSLLASRAGEVVSGETITSALWGSDTPQTAANGVHTYVARLRRALEPGRGSRAASTMLSSEPGGYCLRLEPTDVDARLFVERHGHARRSREGGSAETTLRLYEDALALWRGEAYSGVPGPFAAMEGVRLRDLRLTAVEEWAAVMVEAGEHAEVVDALSRAAAEEPLREKLRWLLMLALYHAGRQAHALTVYTETRQLLRRELGIEPGTELQDLHRRILAGQRELRLPGGSLAPRPREGLGAGVPRPAQLPPVARGFTGRDVELRQLEGLLDDEPAPRSTPVIVVDGPAGVGKSALVLELAHRLSDRFPDGQLYVDLCGNGLRGRPLTASDALLQLLTSLGADSTRIPRDLAGRSTLYRSLLYGRRMLVVLDDALSVDQLRPLIPRGASCVVATSRQRFGGLAARDGARTLTVRPLAVDEAADLLTGLSGGRLAGQAPSARRLAALCGGLPLALRITAEGLAANPGVPLATLVEQYTTESGRLDRFTVADDALASVRDAFETSYQGLPAEAARMFRFLGLCKDEPVTVPMAASLADTEPATARRLLDLLVAHHLLEDHGHRYRLHDLLGIYAAECAKSEPVLNRRAALARLGEARTPAPPEPPAPRAADRAAGEGYAVVMRRAAMLRRAPFRQREELPRPTDLTSR